MKFWGKRHIVRKLAVFTAGVLLTTGIAGSLMPAQAADAALPTELTLPITLIDYNADNLLFEYDLYDAIGKNFAFTYDMFLDATASAGVAPTGIYTTGLVETQLNPDTKLPVYKKEVVEQVARQVQAQLLLPSANDTSATFADLRARLISAPPADAINLTELTDDSGYRLTNDYAQYFYNHDTYQWTVSGGDYTAADGKITRTVGGVETTIWEHDGNGVRYRGTGAADDALLLNLSGLDASKTYRVWRYKDIDTEFTLSVSAGDATYLAGTNTGWDATGNITGVTSMQIAIRPSAASNGNRIANVMLGTEPDSLSNGISMIVDRVQKPNFTKSGWTVEGSGTYAYDSEGTPGNPYAYDTITGEKIWKFEGDGLIGYITDAKAYRNISLNANREYVLSWNGGSGMRVNVYDGANCIASGLKSGEIFRTGANGNVKLEVVSSNAVTAAEAIDWQRDKMVSLAVSEIVCPLGDYATSRAKYADGTKGYVDISTCMDYAYYMLNSMFVAETDAMVKTPYHGYESITLSQVQDGKDDYEFRADISGVPVSVHGTATATALEERYKVVYDKVNKNIRNDRTVIEPHTGLFPLDEAPTKQNGYYGVEAVSGGDPVEHNFHYALRSQSEFHYEEAADLYFTFLGDDDVYLFINGTLALDLGGAHEAATKTIHLNDMKTELGLVDGNNYEFDFFYLERKTKFSNFYMETNIQLLPVGELQMNFYQNGARLEDGSTVEKGSEVEMEYILRSRVNDMNAIQFTDTGLGISIGNDGLTLGSRVRLAPGGLHMRVYNSDGSLKEQRYLDTSEKVGAYFTTLRLDRNEALSVRGLLLTVENELDAEVSVNMKTPRYAGANNNYVSNVSRDDGVLLVKTQQKQDEQPGKAGGNTSSQTQTTKVSSPKTKDDVTFRSLTVAGSCLLLGTGIVCFVLDRRRREMDDILFAPVK